MRDEEIEYQQLHGPAGLSTVELCQSHEVLQIIVISKHLHRVETSL